MQNIRKKILGAKKFLSGKINKSCKLGVLTGTGLSDAVEFSTVMEAIVAVHTGMKVFGLAK